MTRPFTLEEQQKNNWFRPKHRLAMLIGVPVFDQVCRIELIKSKRKDSPDEEEYVLKQALPNLLQAKSDCEVMRECLLRYEFMDKDIAKFYHQDENNRDSNI